MKKSDCIFEAILFDMDGVLVDSEPLHYRAEDRIFESMKINIPAPLRKSFVGISNDLMWKKIQEHLSLSASPADLKAEAEVIRLDFFKNLTELEPLAGVTSLLKKLTETGTGTALASSSAPALIDLLMEKTGLARYFPHRVSGDDVQAGKPAPDIFLEAAGRLAVQPARCCVIEDSYNGITAGKDAGMTVYAFTGTDDGTMDISRADRAFSSFHDISSSLFKDN